MFFVGLINIIATPEHSMPASLKLFEEFLNRFNSGLASFHIVGCFWSDVWSSVVRVLSRREDACLRLDERMNSVNFRGSY